MSTRGKIIQAADRLFGEVGFDASTVQKIAELSKTNKALIHYYFKSKEGLFVCVIDHYFEELTDTLQKSLLGEGFLENRITKTIDRYIQFLEQNRNFVRIIQAKSMGGTRETVSSAIWRRFFRWSSMRYAKLIHRHLPVILRRSSWRSAVME